MNQILEKDTSLSSLSNKTNSSKKKLFKLQFYLSFFLILFVFIGYGIYWFSTNKKYDTIKKITNNYEITNLYSSKINNKIVTYKYDNEVYPIIGMIEIANINISYPIFSDYSDELLKIAPCRFYGPLPNENGNLCIAGHNYNNKKFFSKLSELEINDEIKITDNNGLTFLYFVTDSYEVKESDLSPLEPSNPNQKQITLITCNNVNNNRIIVKAKYYN